MNVAWRIGAATAASAFLTCNANAQEPAPSPAQPPAQPSSATALASASPAFATPFGDPTGASDAIGPDTSDSGVAAAETTAFPPAASVSTVAAAQYDDPWRFSVTPYLFLPAMEGQLRFNPPPAGDGAPLVSIDAGDILSALDFAFMITADAHYGRFGVMTDVMYVDLSAEEARIDQILRPGGIVDVPVDIDTSVDFQSWLWTGAFGVEFGDPGDLTFEPFLGFRYLRSEVDLTWNLQGPIGLFPQSGSLSQEQDVWDGIAGIRGAVAFGEDSRWSVTYYGDVGTGDSELTWQVIGGIGYSYGWGDLRFAWRYLAYDQGDDAFLQDFSMNGPAFGATFRF